MKFVLIAKHWNIGDRDEVQLRDNLGAVGWS